MEAKIRNNYKMYLEDGNEIYLKLANDYYSDYINDGGYKAFRDIVS